MKVQLVQTFTVMEKMGALECGDGAGVNSQPVLSTDRGTGGSKGQVALPTGLQKSLMGVAVPVWPMKSPRPTTTRCRSAPHWRRSTR